MPLPKSPKYVSGLRPITEQGGNPKDEFGLLKVPLALNSPTATVIQAICMDDGNQKYGPYNYRVSKVQGLIYLEAIKRHIEAVIDGEDFDTSGKPHLGYVMACAAIYLDAWINGYLLDNRPVPGKAAELIRLYSRHPKELEKTPNELRDGLLSVIKGYANASPPSSGFEALAELENTNSVNRDRDRDLLALERTNPEVKRGRRKKGNKKGRGKDRQR